MIYFRTFAYNAEKTLEKTICSILEQTYTEFTYYLMDNGSTDGTREIIKKYADEDARIVPFYADKNHDHTQNLSFWHLPYNLQDGDFFCILDGDDYYEPTFLEEMLAFAQENQLDIAACGSRFFDGETGEQCDERVLPCDVILVDAEDYDKHFCKIHWNLRQVWGKLYSARAAKARYETEVPAWWPRAYGGDTINVYSCVKLSERIGIYGKILHSYRISQQSVSYRWIEGREVADLVVFKKTIELLQTKCGHISTENLKYVHLTHFHALMDTFYVLYESDLPGGRKIALTEKMLSEPITKTTLSLKLNVDEAKKKEMLTYIVCSVLDNATDASEETLKQLWSIANVINEKLPVLIPFSAFAWYINKLPLVLRNIILQEYEYGVNNLIGYMVKTKESIPVSHPIVLGQTLAAMREEENKYVFFSKKLIGWCLKNGQLEQAEAELKEWVQLLPEDEDIIGLCNQYNRMVGQ